MKSMKPFKRYIILDKKGEPIEYNDHVIFYTKKKDAERETVKKDGERVQKVRIVAEEDSCK